MKKNKYVIIEEWGIEQIIIFPETLKHDMFKALNPIRGGFCIIQDQKISCFGKSTSLQIESHPEKDTKIATEQLM